MPDFKLACGTVSYEMDEAKAVVAGYAFGTTKVVWNPGKWKPDVAAELMRPVFSYWTYDAVPKDAGDLSYRDVLLTSGIESRIYGRPAAQIMAVAPQVSQSLRKLAKADPFWELPYGHLSKRPSSETDDAWWIWKAWSLLHYLKWSGPATAHKILHHKDSLHFPMVDSVIKGCYKNFPDGEWAGIHRELTDHAEEYKHLEKWFQKLASSKEKAVPLFRLRLHDILVWCANTKSGPTSQTNRKQAADLGKKILGSH